MKIVRLSPTELRPWRENRSHLVDDDGHLVGKLSSALEKAATELGVLAKMRRQKLEKTVTLGNPPKDYLVVADVRRVGIDQNAQIAALTIDGLRVVSGKDVFLAQMFQLHGECQLRMMNGVIIKVVRDPHLLRPTYQQSLQVAPKPEHCGCKNWGAPHPGTHHQTCQWNRHAPPAERAPTEHVSDTELGVLPVEAFEMLAKTSTPTAHQGPSPTTHVVRAVLSSPAVTPAVTVDSPDNCRNGCLSWATPSGRPIPEGQHHPTCVFAKDWAIQTDKREPRWLIDLRNGEKVRRAEDLEVGQAEVEKRRSGSPIIHIGDVPYAVVLESELGEFEDVRVAVADPPPAEPLAEPPSAAEPRSAYGLGPEVQEIGA